MDVRAVGNSGHNCAPAFSQIGRFENVRLEVVEFMPIHSNICSVGIVRRRIDEADSAPLGHLRRDIRPMLSVVRRDMNKSIICARPQGSFFHRRLSEGKDSVVIFNRSNVISQRATAWLLFRFIVARQITADLCPALSVIGRFKNALRSRIQNLGIMWRKSQWRYPLKTMNKISRAVTGIINRQDANVLDFFLGLVVTID